MSKPEKQDVSSWRLLPCGITPDYQRDHQLRPTYVRTCFAYGYSMLSGMCAPEWVALLIAYCDRIGSVFVSRRW